MTFELQRPTWIATIKVRQLTDHRTQIIAHLVTQQKLQLQMKMLQTLFLGKAKEYLLRFHANLEVTGDVA